MNNVKKDIGVIQKKLVVIPNVKVQILEIYQKFSDYKIVPNINIFKHVIVILREEKPKIVILKMEIVIAKKIYVDQSVTNVVKVIMDFQTARVSL